MEAIHPGNETLRLSALRRLQVLDTPDEERFDRITRVAARAFNAPIALVSLVDENRQWFKSCIGLPMRETPRSMSFCAHALLSAEPLVIPDALADERFADNPLVTGEPFIRFYAGQPLTTLEGLPVGTLCILDREPRTFTAADRAVLKDLARWAQDELNAIGKSRTLARHEESEARLLAIYDNVAEAVLVSIDGIVQAANPAALKLFASQRDQIEGAEVINLLPGSPPSHLDLPLGQTRQTEGTARRADGTEFEALVSLAGIQLDGYPAAVVIVRDITEQQAVLAQLHASLEQQSRMYRDAEVARSETRAIIEATSEGIAVISASAGITAADRRFADVFGVRPEDLVDHDIGALEALATRAFRRPDAFLQLLSLDVNAGRRRALMRQTWPQERDLEVLSAPVEATDSRSVSRIFLLRDVTAEAELDRVKSDFVSTVAHELRTPLTAILGFSDLILAGAVDGPESLADDLVIIRNNALRLNELVDDLLDVSKVEAGAIQLEMKAVQLADVVRNVVRSVAPAFSSKGQPLQVDLPPDLPTVQGDRGRLEQVVANLLTNANKYTLPGGEVRVYAEVTDRSVALAVADSGVGLTLEEQARLFSKFFRARNSATQDVGGTGLGLVITRSLVRQHGGDITVESRPGRGSTFTVVLPRPD